MSSVLRTYSATAVPSRARPLGRRRAWALALLMACNRDPSPPAGTEEGKAAAPAEDRSAEQDALRRKAHADALARSVPDAEKAFALADPVAAFERGLGPLAPAPSGVTGLAAARKARRAAFTEIGELDVDLLDPAPAVQLRAIAFGLERIEEAAAGRGPTRTDPTVGIVEAHRVLDVVDRERAHGRRDELPRSLASVGAGLRAALDDLGGASPEGLDAALADLATLRDRVAQLGGLEPSLTDATASLVTELESLRERLARQRAALPDRADMEWSSWPVPARGEPSLRRLTPVLGRQPLTRLLEVEEGLDRPFVEAVPQLLALAGRLDGLASKLGPLPAEPDAARPVDEARCKSAVERARALVEEGDPPPELECSWLTTVWGDRERTDAELMLDVIDDGLIGPHARRQRAAAPDWIALLSGRTAPRAHVLTKGLALTMRLGDAATTRLALARTRDALCSTTASLWIHGELPDRDRLDEWLRTDCPSRDPDAWKEGALLRPRASLDGLALTLVGGPGPVGATMLELVPWAPLGLVPPVARPRRSPQNQQEPEMFWLGPDLQPLDETER